MTAALKKNEVEITATQDWNDYEAGVLLKHKLGLYNDVELAYRFYENDHWRGVVSNGLPTLQFNIIKRVIGYKKASLMSSPYRISYVAENVAEDAQDEFGKKANDAAALLTDYAGTLWKRLGMDTLLEDAVEDAALSSDGCAHFWWDEEIDAGDGLNGDIAGELIDNTDVFFGNPNSRIVNDYRGRPRQPWIIIAYRMNVEEVRAEARANGLPEDKVNLIVADTESTRRSGDAGKIELDNSNVTCLLRYWKKVTVTEDPKTHKKTRKYSIWARKSTQTVVFSKGGNDGYDTGLRRYPVAWMNWEKRKNSMHGVSDAKGLIPNQIAFNKLISYAALAVYFMCNPKPLYNADFIDSWSNAIGTAIAVRNVPPNMSLQQVATYMRPGNLPADIYKLYSDIADYTKEMMGATDVSLGDINPQNTSAMIVAKNQSAVPLKNPQKRITRFVQDIGYIWWDFIRAKYTAERKLPVMRAPAPPEETPAHGPEAPAPWMAAQATGAPSVMPMPGAPDGMQLPPAPKKVRMMVPFNAKDLQDLELSVTVEAGPSTEWSELIQNNELDNLLKGGYINVVQYLERKPDNLIPKKEELIAEIRGELNAQFQMQTGMTLDGAAAGEASAAGGNSAIYEQMAAYVDSLDPEEKEILERLRVLNPERYEQAIINLMNQDMGGAPV